jgi:hypothetical protein
MNETAFDKIAALLARGESAAARAYLEHFPHEHRAPGVLRAGLAARVLPEHMELFERTAPWLVSDDDDLTARIRLALGKVGRDGLTMNALARKFPGVPAAEVRERAWAMVNVRDVHVERRRSGGRKAEVFRLFDYAAGIPSANIQNDPGSWRPLPLE